MELLEDLTFPSFYLPAVPILCYQPEPQSALFWEKQFNLVCNDLFNGISPQCHVQQCFAAITLLISPKCFSLYLSFCHWTHWLNHFWKGAAETRGSAHHTFYQHKTCSCKPLRACISHTSLVKRCRPVLLYCSLRGKSNLQVGVTCFSFWLQSL